MHLENCGLRDEFKTIYELVKLLVVLSGGASHNVKSFRDQYVKLVDRFDELKKVSPSVDMFSQAEMDMVRCELSVMQNE